MRKLLSVGLVSMSLLLAQCSTTQVQNIEAFIGQVQAYTAVACKFVPTVATIIAIVNSGIGQVVGAVGMAICNSLPPPAVMSAPMLHAGPAATVGSVGGVPITGWRVP